MHGCLQSSCRACHLGGVVPVLEKLRIESFVGRPPLRRILHEQLGDEPCRVGLDVSQAFQLHFFGLLPDASTFVSWYGSFLDFLHDEQSERCIRYFIFTLFC
jgi:hypothetical protein